MSLVGSIENENIVKFIWVRMSPFDFILLPDNLLPGVEIGAWNKQIQGEFNEAGYKIKKSAYLEGILAGQLAVVFAIQNVIFGVIYVLIRSIIPNKLKFLHTFSSKLL